MQQLKWFQLTLRSGIARFLRDSWASCYNNDMQTTNIQREWNLASILAHVEMRKTVGICCWFGWFLYNSVAQFLSDVSFLKLPQQDGVCLKRQWESRLWALHKNKQQKRISLTTVWDWRRLMLSPIAFLNIGRLFSHAHGSRGVMFLTCSSVCLSVFSTRYLKNRCC